MILDLDKQIERAAHLGRTCTLRLSVGDIDRLNAALSRLRESETEPVRTPAAIEAQVEEWRRTGRL